MLEDLVLSTEPAEFFPLLGGKPFTLPGIDLLLFTQLRRVLAEIPSSLAILEMGLSSGAERTSRIASRQNSGEYGGFLFWAPRLLLLVDVHNQVSICPLK